MYLTVAHLSSDLKQHLNQVSYSDTQMIQIDCLVSMVSLTLNVLSLWILCLNQFYIFFSSQTKLVWIPAWSQYWLYQWIPEGISTTYRKKAKTFIHSVVNDLIIFSPSILEHCGWKNNGIWVLSTLKHWFCHSQSSTEHPSGQSKTNVSPSDNDPDEYFNRF